MDAETKRAIIKDLKETDPVIWICSKHDELTVSSPPKWLLDKYNFGVLRCPRCAEEGVVTFLIEK